MKLNMAEMEMKGSCGYFEETTPRVLKEILREKVFLEIYYQGKKYSMVMLPMEIQRKMAVEVV